MDAHPLLMEKGTLTVSALTDLGESRHVARHALEGLVGRGLAQKSKEGNTVVYSLIVPAEPAPQTDTKVSAVVKALRPRKALSVGMIARRTGLPPADVRKALIVAGTCGLAIRPFKHSQRFRRP